MEIGKSYFVRTDTDHWLGELVSIDGPYTVTLNKFSWIADTGRLGNFLRTGQASEVEVALPKQTIKLNFRAVISWPHPLPKEDI